MVGSPAWHGPGHILAAQGPWKGKRVNRGPQEVRGGEDATCPDFMEASEKSLPQGR